jgi:sec-independent protein translocase protein TatA
MVNYLQTLSDMQALYVITGILGGLGAPEIILIALIVLLLFGGRKIPELMRGMGKGIKNFKEGMKGMEDEINQPEKPAGYKESDKESTAGSKS